MEIMEDVGKLEQNESNTFLTFKESKEQLEVEDVNIFALMKDEFERERVPLSCPSNRRNVIKTDWNYKRKYIRKVFSRTSHASRISKLSLHRILKVCH